MGKTYRPDPPGFDFYGPHNMRGAAMRKKTAQTLETISRRNTRQRDDDQADICDSPLCFRFDVEFDPKTISLSGVELYDPDAKDEDEIWRRYDVSLLNAQGKAAALAALKRAAEDGMLDIDCADDKCLCRRRGRKWSAWSGWNQTEIVAGFSIPNPQPPPKRLRFRANGTVNVRSRVKIGTCYRIQA